MLNAIPLKFATWRLRNEVGRRTRQRPREFNDARRPNRRRGRQAAHGHTELSDARSRSVPEDDGEASIVWHQVINDAEQADVLDVDVLERRWAGFAVDIPDKASMFLAPLPMAINIHGEVVQLFATEADWATLYFAERQLRPTMRTRAENHTNRIFPLSSSVAQISMEERRQRSRSTAQEGANRLYTYVDTIMLRDIHAIITHLRDAYSSCIRTLSAREASALLGDPRQSEGIDSVGRGKEFDDAQSEKNLPRVRSFQSNRSRRTAGFERRTHSRSSSDIARQDDPPLAIQRSVKQFSQESQAFSTGGPVGQKSVRQFSQESQAISTGGLEEERSCDRPQSTISVNTTSSAVRTVHDLRDAYSRTEFIDFRKFVHSLGLEAHYNLLCRLFRDSSAAQENTADTTYRKVFEKENEYLRMLYRNGKRRRQRLRVSRQSRAMMSPLAGSPIRPISSFSGRALIAQTTPRPTMPKERQSDALANPLEESVARRIDAPSTDDPNSLPFARTLPNSFTGSTRRLSFHRRRHLTDDYGGLSDLMDLRHFAVQLWNICSLDSHGLMLLAFRAYAHNSNLAITSELFNRTPASPTSSQAESPHSRRARGHAERMLSMKRPDPPTYDGVLADLLILFKDMGLIETTQADQLGQTMRSVMPRGSLASSTRSSLASIQSPPGQGGGNSTASFFDAEAKSPKINQDELHEQMAKPMSPRASSALPKLSEKLFQDLRKPLEATEMSRDETVRPYSPANTVHSTTRGNPAAKYDLSDQCDDKEVTEFLRFAGLRPHDENLETSTSRDLEWFQLEGAFTNYFGKRGLLWPLTRVHFWLREAAGFPESVQASKRRGCNASNSPIRRGGIEVDPETTPKDSPVGPYNPHDKVSNLPSSSEMHGRKERSPQQGQWIRAWAVRNRYTVAYDGIGEGRGIRAGETKRRVVTDVGELLALAAMSELHKKTRVNGMPSTSIIMHQFSRGARQLSRQLSRPFSNVSSSPSLTSVNSQTSLGRLGKLDSARRQTRSGQLGKISGTLVKISHAFSSSRLAPQLSETVAKAPSAYSSASLTPQNVPRQASTSLPPPSPPPGDAEDSSSHESITLRTSYNTANSLDDNASDLLQDECCCFVFRRRQHYRKVVPFTSSPSLHAVPKPDIERISSPTMERSISYGDEAVVPFDEAQIEDEESPDAVVPFDDCQIEDFKEEEKDDFVPTRAAWASARMLELVEVNEL